VKKQIKADYLKWLSRKEGTFLASLEEKPIKITFSENGYSIAECDKDIDVGKLKKDSSKKRERDQRIFLKLSPCIRNFILRKNLNTIDQPNKKTQARKRHRSSILISRNLSLSSKN